jgi:Na+-driven multidrug efflux pump
MRALLSKWLIIEHLLKYSLVTQASGAILNVLLNFLLIPAYHGVGAAFATLISYAAASYFALFLSY